MACCKPFVLTGSKANHLRKRRTPYGKPSSENLRRRSTKQHEPVTDHTTGTGLRAAIRNHVQPPRSACETLRHTLNYQLVIKGQRFNEESEQSMTNTTTDLPYKNPDLPTQERIADLLGRMTLEEGRPDDAA